MDTGGGASFQKLVYTSPVPGFRSTEIRMMTFRTRLGSVSSEVRELRKLKNIKPLAFILGALLWVALPASGQTETSRFQVTHYSIDATLYPSTHILAAKVAI